MMRCSPSARFILFLLSLFVALSVADLVLTRSVIDRSGGLAGESNPVADWWLANMGWSGMTGYKLAMVALILTLAGGITYLRPRTGELLLVFACGAQGTVVIGSIFHLNARPTPLAESANDSLQDPHLSSHVLPEAGIQLLTQKAVQDELKLSEGQVKQATWVANLRRDLGRALRQSDLEEFRIRLEFLIAQEKQLLGAMEPAQTRRLRQLVWQHRGCLIFDNAAICDALALDADQQEAVGMVVEETRKAIAGGRGSSESVDHVLAQADSQIRGHLTAAQIAKWQELLGPVLPNVIRPRIYVAFNTAEAP